MQQDKLIQNYSYPVQAKQHSVSGLSTAGSPKNINQLANYMFTTATNQYQSSHNNNPQAIFNKPSSVQIYQSTQTTRVINQGVGTKAVPQSQVVRANQGDSSHEQNLVKPLSSNAVFGSGNQNTELNSHYQRLVSNNRVAPSRPNYHFFGSQSRQNYNIQSHTVHPPQTNIVASPNNLVNTGSRQHVSTSHSHSPPVIINTTANNISINAHNPHANISVHSHSHSPLSIQSNSSQANKLVRSRVRFSYTSNQQPSIMTSPQPVNNIINTALNSNNNLESFHVVHKPVQQLQPAHNTHNVQISTHGNSVVNNTHSHTNVWNQLQTHVNGHQLENNMNTMQNNVNVVKNQDHHQHTLMTNVHPIQNIPNINYHQPQPNYPHPPQYPSINPGYMIHSSPYPLPQQAYPQHPIVVHPHYGNMPYPNNFPPGHTTITTTHTIIWQHRFVAIYSKFQIFVEKFQNIIQEIYYIDDLFDNVNDQEAWNDLRVRYTDMIQSFNTMREDIILVLENNKDAINSLSPEVVKQISQKQIKQEQQIARQQEHQGNANSRNQGEQQQEERNQEEGGQTGKSGSQNNHIWQNRCLEMMQQHQILTKQNKQLKNQIQRLSIQNHEQQNYGQKKPRVSQPQSSNSNTKIIQMQKNLNLIHSQYQKLQLNYNNLSAQYSRVVSQLQMRAHSNENRGQSSNQDVAQMQQQLQMAQAKINQLYEQLQSKTENIEQLQKQIQSYGQILQQNKTLMDTVNKMNQDLQGYQNQFKNKDKIIGQYDQQMKNLHEQIIQYSKTLQQRQQQYNAQVSTTNNKSLQHDRSKQDLQKLKQQNLNLVTMIQKHEQSIQQMALKNQKTITQNQIALKQRDEQLKILQNYLQQQRLAKIKAVSSVQQYQISHNPNFENIIQTNIFKQRLQLEIDQVVHEKNRKIRLLTQDLEEVRYQLESIEKDKQKEIKHIKQFFAQEEDKYLKKIQQKQANIKLLNQKSKSFEHELSSRNQQISKFRHQSPVNSFTGNNDQSKKFQQNLQKKNHQIQQLKRTIEQRAINIKQLQQKIISLEQQIQGKMFEINSLKRQANDLHGNRAEVDNLNSMLKKKNQQLNQLRLTVVEMEQLKINVDSLEREKIRLNQYLKEKTRECQAKDTSIQTLQRKLNSMSFQHVGSMSRKTSIQGPNPAIVNYQNLLKQRQNQNKNMKYQIDLLQTKIQGNQKTIKDLNLKVTNHQKSSSILKAQMQNKANRYQSDIKALNKQIKSLSDKKQQLTNQLQSLQSKNISLQKVLDERNSLFDRQTSKNKQKISAVEQHNTVLLVDQDLIKSQADRLVKENKDLIDRIRNLENRMEEKNKIISQIKGDFNRKQRQDAKYYEDKIKVLDGQLKLSAVKLRKMQEQISNLNKKIQFTQSQKKSYRDRLLKDNTIPKQQYIDFKSQYQLSSYDMQQLQRFKLKDPQANDIFQRKVIYQLKRQNDFLKKQLSGLHPGSYSAVVNRLQNQAQNLSYQRDFFTSRDHQQSKHDQYNNQVIGFYKNKNKQLEQRIDELLKLNTQFKAKITSLSANSANQSSIQFYKQQVKSLQSQNNQLKAKIKKMINDHQSVYEQISGHEHEKDSLRSKVNEQDFKVNQLRLKIQRYQNQIAQLENTKQICYAEIQRLKQMLLNSKQDKQQISKRDKTISQATRKQKSLQQQITKLSNKGNIQTAQIQRLTEQLSSKNSTLDNKYAQTTQQSKKLKRKILELQKQIQMLKMQYQYETKNRNSGQNMYRIEKLRSYLVQIQCLAKEIPLNKDKRAHETVQQLCHEVHEGLNIVSLIYV